MKLNSLIKQTPSLKFTLIDRINLKNKKKLEKEKIDYLSIFLLVLNLKFFHVEIAVILL